MYSLYISLCGAKEGLRTNRPNIVRDNLTVAEIEIRLAGRANVLLFALACWGQSPQSPVMQSKLCGCAGEAGGCADARAPKKAVDLPDGAGVSAFRLQYIPLYSKRSCLGGITIDSQTEVETMRIIRYDKLVRDRIPEIIKASGKSCATEVLSDEAYLSLDQQLLFGMLRTW